MHMNFQEHREWLKLDPELRDRGLRGKIAEYDV